MDTTHSHIPRLNWVIVEGHLCDVSEFRDLPPKARPKAHCPLCERQVTLKLGEKRAHHFAHRPEDICAATIRETAIHLNCKFHIYRQLQTAKTVYTTNSCRRCGKGNPIVWKQDWDAVEVEYKMNTMRPDIALLQNGKVIGTIEIFVTHEVNEEKAQRLQSEAIDWIEVRGHEGIYEEPDAWRVEKALRTIRQHPEPPSWICPECQKLREQEEYRRNHHVRILYAKLIDVYFRSGKKYRHMFFVKEELTFGEKTRLWLEDENGDVIAKESSPISKQSQDRLNAAFKKKVLEFRRIAVVVDDEMNWRQWLQGQKFVPRDTDKFPFRYIWNQAKSRWELLSQ